jgi:hypothetical protein
VNANRPTRATTDGRAYLDLQNLARHDHRPTDEYVQLYALEGMLARLTSSDHADKFVLKGGALLAAYQARRPTRDIDFAATGMANEAAAVLQTYPSDRADPHGRWPDLRQRNGQRRHHP